MNREIKFRAWQNSKTPRRAEMLPHTAINNIRYLGDTNHFNSVSVVKGYANHYTLIGEDEVILLQYTGLKDKNGKEIYEGDIVTLQEQWIDKNSGDVDEENPYNLEVCFVNYRWELIAFRVNENGVKMPSLCLNLCDFRDYSFGFCIDNHNRDFHCKTIYTTPEVIGNIYENPELIQ